MLIRAINIYEKLQAGYQKTQKLMLISKIKKLLKISPQKRYQQKMKEILSFFHFYS
jgi:hypothetical protein